MLSFGTNIWVIGVASPNWFDSLVPVRLRPGHFGRKVSLGRPDVQEREASLHVPTRGQPLAPTISLTDSATVTPAPVGADLENLALPASFFSTTAHELKTLTPTLCPLPHLSSQTQAEISQTFAQNLDLLVTDILESARLKAGTVALHPRSLDLVSRTRRVLEP